MNIVGNKRKRRPRPLRRWKKSKRFWLWNEQIFRFFYSKQQTMHEYQVITLASDFTCNHLVISTSKVTTYYYYYYLDPEGGSQKATLVVVLVVISSLKISKAVQRNFAHTFVLILPTDLPSQIFHLFSH